MPRMLTKDQRGFTLVEIAIVAPMMILIAVTIVAILVILVSNTVGPNARSILMQQEERSFESIESDVNNSLGMLSALPGSFSDSAANDYATPPANTTVLRVQTFDQIINPNDTSGTKVIPAFKGTAPCTNTTDLSASNIVPIVAIYYVKNNILYRRTLTDTTTPATCGTKLAKQSCLTSCTSQDLELLRADEIKKFEVIYYTTITGDIVTTDPTAAKSARITITSAIDAGGETQEYTAALRVARLN